MFGLVRGDRALQFMYAADLGSGRVTYTGLCCLNTWRGDSLVSVCLVESTGSFRGLLHKLGSRDIRTPVFVPLGFSAHVSGLRSRV